MVARIKDDKKQKLILISGEAWTGKTTISAIMNERLYNSAWLDGDDVWRVNPWDLDDPRLRNSDLNMAYVITNYLRSNFQYVILSTIVLCVDDIRDRIIDLIEYKDYKLIHITLICDPGILKKRASMRDGNKSPDFMFLDRSKNIDGSIKINTGGRSKESVVQEIMRHLQ